MADVFAVIGDVIRTQPEVGSEEGCAQFCDQFFHGVSVITEPLAELAVQTVLGAGPVNQLVHGRCVGLFDIAIEGHFRQTDVIRTGGIVGLIAGPADAGARGALEPGRTAQGLALSTSQ